MGRSSFGPMYGLTEAQVSNLRTRWRKLKLSETDFADFDFFVEWCSENGFDDGCVLKKRIRDLPFGPDNTDIYFPKKSEPKPEGEPPAPPKPKPRKIETADLCKTCTKECNSAEIGCKEWRANYVKFWNKYIYRNMTGTEHTSKMFRYEHPDLVREGIVFEASR